MKQGTFPGLEKKKELSSCLEQADFLGGKLLFFLTCVMGKGPGKPSAN